MADHGSEEHMSMIRSALNRVSESMSAVMSLLAPEGAETEKSYWKGLKTEEGDVDLKRLPGVLEKIADDVGEVRKGLRTFIRKTAEAKAAAPAADELEALKKAVEELGGDIMTEEKVKGMIEKALEEALVPVGADKGEKVEKGDKDGETDEDDE